MSSFERVLEYSNLVGKINMTLNLYEQAVDNVSRDDNGKFSCMRQSKP